MVLDKVRGQENALHFLKGILRSQRFPKAMVFHGPSGVGKGYAARLFGLQCCLTGDLQHDEVTTRMFEQNDHPELNFYRPEDCYTEAELNRRKTEPTWKVSSVRDFLEVARDPVLYSKRRTIVFEDFHRLAYGQQSIPDAFLKLLEDGIDQTTVILTTADYDNLPGTLKGRLTPVRFTALTPEILTDLLTEHKDHPEFDLSCKLGRGSLDTARSYLDPDSEDLSASALLDRVFRLLRLIPHTAPGKIFLFISALSSNDQLKFMSVFKDVYSDVLLLESGVTQGLLYPDRIDALHAILETYEGNLASGLKALRTLDDRLLQSGIKVDHQIKAALLQFKLLTTKRT